MDMTVTEMCGLCDSQVEDEDPVFQCTRCVHPVCEYCDGELDQVLFLQRAGEHYCTNYGSTDNKDSNEEDSNDN